MTLGWIQFVPLGQRAQAACRDARGASRFGPPHRSSFPQARHAPHLGPERRAARPAALPAPPGRPPHPPTANALQGEPKAGGGAALCGTPDDGRGHRRGRGHPPPAGSPSTSTTRAARGRCHGPHCPPGGPVEGEWPRGAATQRGPQREWTPRGLTFVRDFLRSAPRRGSPRPTSRGAAVRGGGGLARPGTAPTGGGYRPMSRGAGTGSLSRRFGTGPAAGRARPGKRPGLLDQAAGESQAKPSQRASPAAGSAPGGGAPPARRGATIRGLDVPVEPRGPRPRTSRPPGARARAPATTRAWRRGRHARRRRGRPRGGRGAHLELLHHLHAANGGEVGAFEPGGPAAARQRGVALALVAPHLSRRGNGLCLPPVLAGSLASLLGDEDHLRPWLVDSMNRVVH